MLGWTPGLLHSWTVHWEPTLSQDRPAINRTCTQLQLAVPGKFTKLHLLKQNDTGSGLKLRVPPKWAWAAAAGSAWQAHQITFTVLKQMIQAQVSNSGPHLGGRGQLLLAVPGKSTTLHLLKQMTQAQVSN